MSARRAQLSASIGARVRSGPRGDHQPTANDVEDARRLKHALALIEVPLVDYIIVGESVTSLVQRRVI